MAVAAFEMGAGATAVALSWARSGVAAFCAAGGTGVSAGRAAQATVPKSAMAK